MNTPVDMMVFDYYSKGEKLAHMFPLDGVTSSYHSAPGLRSTQGNTQSHRGRSPGCNEVMGYRCLN